MGFKEFLEEQKSADEILVRFKNSPTKMAPKLLFESLLSPIQEGKEKEWKKGYTYRVDRRPQNMGGDQIHIYKGKNKAWAYRDNGMKSEPNKYSSPVTNIVKDIVSDVFKISGSNIEEASIVTAKDGELIVEIIFS